MKQYKLMCTTCLAILLGAFLFTGCTKDEAAEGEEEAAAGKALLTIVPGVSEAAGTRADNPVLDTQNRNGSWIKDMTIFFFTPGAGDDSKPLLAKTAEIKKEELAQPNQVSSIGLTGQELSDADIALGTQVDIYAVANHIPDNAADLTKKQVMELTTELPIRKMYFGQYMGLVPMSGVVTDYKITSEANQQANIILHRAVVRVKVTVIDDEFDSEKAKLGQYSWSLMELKLYNDYATTYLWNEGIPATPSCRKETAAIRKYMPDEDADPGAGGYPQGPEYVLGEFYLNSNEASDANPAPANRITVKVTGSRRYYDKGYTVIPYEYTIGLKRPDGTFHFSRNTYLKVTITLKDKGYGTQMEIVPWDVIVDNEDLNPIDGE